MSPRLYRRPTMAVACAALFVAVSSPAWAEPSPSYFDLLAALRETPAALSADAMADAANARVRQAGARPNPSVSVDVDNAVGWGPNLGSDQIETTLSVSQDLELWGRRTARVGVARAEAGTAALQRDFAVIEASGRLALTYAEAELAQRRAALAKEALDLALADARAALRLVESGREPLLRGIQGETEAAAARAAYDEAVAEREAAFARLTAVAMLPVPVTEVPTSLVEVEPRPTPSNDDAMSVRVAQSERLAAERRIDFEKTRTRPDVSATVGLRRSQADDTTSVNFGLSMSLPLFDRNQGNIDAAYAEYRAADARLMGARQDAQADNAAATARLNASTSRLRATDSGVTAAEEAYRLARLGFDAGRISQLELRVTRAALINARNASLEARLARVRAEIDLARLEGRAPFQGAR